jgi:hypothetical protein
LKTLCILGIVFISLFLTPTARYSVIPHAQIENHASEATEARQWVYSQAEINAMTAGAFHPFILRTLIKYESQNTNVARMDSNHLMSFGDCNSMKRHGGSFRRSRSIRNPNGAGEGDQGSRLHDLDRPAPPLDVRPADGLDIKKPPFKPHKLIGRNRDPPC